MLIFPLLLSGGEFQAKLKKLRDFMERRGLSSLLLSTQSSFAWLTGGGTSTVVISSELGAVSLLITPKQFFLIAPNDEVPRFTEEELKGFPVKVLSYPWFKGIESDETLRLARKYGGKKIGSDVRRPGTIFVAQGLSKLRYQLLPQEMERYRKVARLAAEAAEKVARNLKPGMSEEEIRAQVAYELFKRGLIPTVLLIGVDQGIMKYRHVIPKGRVLRKYAQINICARKYGLVVALTRLVHFGPLPEELKKRQRVAEKVYAAFLYGLRPGAELSRVFTQAISVYGKYGYPEEWKNHHQGGAIGYAEREFIVTSKTREKVYLHQAFAFNPTLPGAKVEDTVLVTEKGVEVLTYTGKWPYHWVEYKGKRFRVPEILIK